MARRKAKKQTVKQVETLVHKEATRRNIPTAEYQPVMRGDDQDPIRVAYERRNPDLDPQLVWRGKDMQDWSDLVVQAPPLFIQEKVHPKVLIDDLARMTREARAEQQATEPGLQADLFGDFNGLPDEDAKTEFYQHDANWSNRMILGDSLQVMASLAEREGLRGKVQCIYMDPPYGIKFNSNFQWSTTRRDVKDGKAEHITREPEQVKAFRDTWRDGIHSYLTYLRDRLTVARDLLTESGSIFVQIGDENVHRVRTVMDEVFGAENFASLIFFLKTTGKGSQFLDSSGDYILWYAKNQMSTKVRPLFRTRKPQTLAEQYNMAAEDNCTYRRLSRKELNAPSEIPEDNRRFMPSSIYSDSGGETTDFTYNHGGSRFKALRGYFWRTTRAGLDRLDRASRLCVVGNYLRYRMYGDDYPIVEITNYWDDVRAGGFGDAKVYVVQTANDVLERCILMATDPGDLVLDPTCGSGTAAYVAEQWGRRWITIDTSRVALALARSRVMGARYPYYLLADSLEGRRKEAELSRRATSGGTTYDDIRQGFVYERVPHITLRSIVNNAEIDVVHEQLHPKVAAALAVLNEALADHNIPFAVETGGRKGQMIAFDTTTETIALPSGESAPANAFLEWEVPREAQESWPAAARAAHDRFWHARLARQREVDACIAASAEYEHLYDRPYQDNKKVRVAGPFTVESLSPHRLAALDENDELMVQDSHRGYDLGADVTRQDFAHVILENLRTAGVQQARKARSHHILVTRAMAWRSHLRRRPLPRKRQRQGASRRCPSSGQNLVPSPDRDLVRANP